MKIDYKVSSIRLTIIIEFLISKLIDERLEEHNRYGYASKYDVYKCRLSEREKVLEEIKNINYENEMLNIIEENNIFKRIKEKENGKDKK